MTNANGTHRNICRDDRLVSDYIALSSNIANHLFFESDKLNVFTAIGTSCPFSKIFRLASSHAEDCPVRFFI